MYQKRIAWNITGKKESEKEEGGNQTKIQNVWNQRQNLWNAVDQKGQEDRGHMCWK